jgi:glutamate carboxypeptidase
MESNRIGAAVRAQLDPDRLVAELADLVGLESPSHDHQASARIAERLAARWRDLGEVSLVTEEVGTHVLVDVPGTGTAPVVLLGHSDTVWPLGTLAGPVPLRIDTEVMAGPGVYDMKAGLVVMVAAVEALSALGAPHPPLRVVIAADEEVGSASATHLVREACAGASAVLGFESPHPDGSLKVGRLGSTRLRLSVAGREAHAALDPEAGVSAIEELVDQLLVVREAIAGIAARRPGELLYNLGAISGGGRTNVIPGAAEALLGLRFGTLGAEADAHAALAALAPVRRGAVLDTETLSARPAWQASAADRALLDSIAAVSSALGSPLGGRPAAGAADTNTAGALGVATVDGFGPLGGGAHAAGEHVRIASLLDRIVLLAAFLAEAARTRE